MDTTAALDSLRAFRADTYACFRYRADALFELMDALLTTGPTLSPAHLSLAPAHRRNWGSTYAALAHGRMTRRALRDLLARHPLTDGQPIYAVDVSGGRAATPRPAPSVATTITRRATRPASHRRGLGLPVDQPTESGPR